MRLEVKSPFKQYVLEMPFFSVIVPLYNKESYVLRAINSILNQTFTDFELLIVNDNSTDNSLQIVEKINSDKIRIIQHESNKGLAATRNTGIRNATSEYITFLDADDEWYPFFLETIYDLILKFPEVGIYTTAYEEIWNSKSIRINNGTEKLDVNFVGKLDFFKTSTNEGIYCHGSVCFKKNVFSTIGLYDENIKLFEDIDFNIRVNSKFSLVYSNKIGMKYYIGTQNQMTRNKINPTILPEYSKYSNLLPNNKDFIKYLNNLHYLKIKKIKQHSNSNEWKQHSTSLNFKLLNWKQKLVLFLPKNILNLLSYINQILAKVGIKASTLS